MFGGGIAAGVLRVYCIRRLTNPVIAQWISILESKTRDLLGRSRYYYKLTPVTLPSGYPKGTPPPILYKYLGSAGAAAFLSRPQLRYTKFIDLDDVLDTMPGFTPMTDEEARANAVERVQRNPVEGISLEHQLIIWEEYGKISTSYFERSMREITAEQGEFPYVCSLTAEAGSLAMWSLYAERHKGIVFGIGSKLNRVLADKGRHVQQMQYSPRRPHTPANNPKFEDVVPALWTKGMDWAHQREWRILSENGDTDYLECGEVLEVIFGYRYDEAISGAKSEHMQRDLFRDTKFFNSFPSPTEHKMIPIRSSERSTQET